MIHKGTRSRTRSRVSGSSSAAPRATRRRGSRDRVLRAADRVRGCRARPSSRRSASRSSAARSGSGSARTSASPALVSASRARRRGAPLLERGRHRGAFRLRGAAGAQFEQSLETMFALAADGRTNRKGMPNPLRLAVIARHHFDDVQLRVPARLVAAVRARPRLAARARTRVRAHLRAAGGEPADGARRLSMRRRLRRRLFWTSVVVGLLLLVLAATVAQAVVAAPRVAWRLPGRLAAALLTARRRSTRRTQLTETRDRHVVQLVG